MRMGKPNDALAAAKCALKLRPTSSACFALLGSVLMQQNPDNANSRNEVRRGEEKHLTELAVLRSASVNCVVVSFLSDVPRPS